MWHLSVFSAVILTSFCLADPQNSIGVGCGRRGSYDAEKEGIDFNIAEAQPGEFPWAVMVMLNSGYLSDGVMIHPQAVLVLKNDVYYMFQKDLRVFEKIFAQIKTVKEVISHNTENEITSTTPHPIAILILSSPFALPNNFPVMCVPRKNDQYDGTRCVITQWHLNQGMWSPFLAMKDRRRLMKIGASIVPYDKVVPSFQKYNDLHPNKTLEASPHFIYATNEQHPRLIDTDTTGSALICPLWNDHSRYVLVGMDTSDHRCKPTSAICLPYQFANISDARQWIDEKIIGNRLDYLAYTA